MERGTFHKIKCIKQRATALPMGRVAVLRKLAGLLCASAITLPRDDTTSTLVGRHIGNME